MVDFVAAGRQLGMDSAFTRKVSSLGAGGRHRSNFERDSNRFAKENLGVKFELYQTPCIVRSAASATQEQNIEILLPHEVAHILWHYNPEKFNEIFQPARIRRFWEKTISAMEPWFRLHPLRHLITGAEDRAMYLPIHLFGDDGCLRKTRVMKTITWYPATFTRLQPLESRIPTYVIPQHIVLKDITEGELQSVIAWSFTVWAKGTLPELDHKRNPFPAGSFRGRIAEAGTPIAGGRTGVYVSTIADAVWMKEHYRFPMSWARTDICMKCFARNDSGPFIFASCTDFPERSHADYMASDAAAKSPLTLIPGYHLSLNRGEPMHTGPLGCMPDAAGSVVVDLCMENVFGCGDLSGWDYRLQAQLNVAYSEFMLWCKNAHQSHTIKKFGRHGMSMKTLHGSFPFYKGKAHNCLVLCRWLNTVCATRIETPMKQLRSYVLWAWVSFSELCFNAADEDFLSTDELKRLDEIIRLLLHGSRTLSFFCAAEGLARWKLRPKMHTMFHVNKEAQASGRNPRAWCSCKDEEMMGRLAK